MEKVDVEGSARPVMKVEGLVIKAVLSVRREHPSTNARLMIRILRHELRQTKDERREKKKRRKEEHEKGVGARRREKRTQNQNRKPQTNETSISRTS